MAEHKEAILEREYTIPLRRFWFRVAMYERTSRAIKAIKQFVAKHMKVEDRDVDKVKLDVYFNNAMWARGRSNPPAKIRVKVRKENGIVKVDFVDVPKSVSFARIRHAKLHSKSESKPSVKSEVPAQEAKSEEQKKDESEKGKSSAIAKEAEIKQEVKADKHTTKSEKAQRPQRMALKK
ncbi:MAG: 50S ribosomal protein L31e [Nanoarchaeota archaeon]